MIRAVIFDWGGVVAREKNGGWRTSFQQLTGLPPQEALTLWDEAYQGLNTGASNESMFWEKVEGALGRQLSDSKYNLWVDGMADETWPQVLELAKQLRSKGIKTAVLSNTVQMISKPFRKANVYADFDPVILSDEVGVAKPDVRIYDLILKALSVNAEDCIFVDDVAKNLDPARSLGMHVVLAGNNPDATVEDILSIIEAH